MTAAVRQLECSRHTLPALCSLLVAGCATRQGLRPLRTESGMNAAQRMQLRRLLAIYAGRMTPRAAADQLARIDRAGFERLRFAWAGSGRTGEPHYYRIHGPTVLVDATLSTRRITCTHG